MILIVDGDVEMGASIERVLRYRGFNALAVHNPMEALALLELRKPKLVVLELTLNHMDGLIFLKAIRKDEKFSDLSVIIYTNEFADERRRAALQAGAQEFIVKGTVGWESFVQRVREYYPDSPKPLL